MMDTRGKGVRRRATIRRRLFWLLGGMSLATLLVVNLVWLPDTIRDINTIPNDVSIVVRPL